MGTDARLFAVNSKQSFYFDRLYNIPSERDEPLRTTGLPLDVLKYRIECLIKGETYSPQEGDYGNTERDPCLEWLKDIEQWLYSLPKDEIVFIRDDSQDEYFELMKEGGYVDAKI